MRATIDWSYDLLDHPERALFAQLAVFAGGCTVEAAEAVCDAELDVLTALVDASLLRERPGARGEVRFAMLEVVREYAVERLEERGESEQLRRRHAEHYADLGERAEPELTGAEAVRWLEHLEAEHDNIRAALAWAGAAGDRELELGLAGSMHYFWRLRGYLTEGRRWLEPAVSRKGVAPAGVRARALTALSAIVDRQGEHERCVRLLEEALDLFREAGDDRRAARTLSELGGAAVLTGDLDRATALFEETLPVFRAAEDRRAEMVTLSNLGAVANLQGDYERGRRLTEEALALARKGGDLDQTGISLHNLGRAALAQGDRDEATRFFDESLGISVELGYRELVANCLEGLAEVAAAHGDPERSARVVGAAEAVLADLGAHFGPEEQQGYERTLARLSAALGADVLEALRAEGAALPLDNAVALARTTG
jgi:predicted ATPase